MEKGNQQDRLTRRFGEATNIYTEESRDGKYIYTVYIHLPYIHVYTRLLKRGPYIHVKNVFYNHIGYYYLKQPAHGESITTGG